MKKSTFEKFYVKPKKGPLFSDFTLKKGALLRNFSKIKRKSPLTLSDFTLKKGPLLRNSTRNQKNPLLYNFTLKKGPLF